MNFLVLFGFAVCGLRWYFVLRYSWFFDRHHRVCEHGLHLHRGPTIPNYALSHEVWLVHLLCIFRATHASFYLFLLAGDQEYSHLRNDLCVEEALVLEEIHA